MFGGQSTDQRDTYQKAAFLGFKSGDADAFVCNNVVAGAGSNATDAASRANRVSPYYESYNIHTYQAVQDYAQQFAPARLMASHSTPVWLSECGIHLPAATAAPWSDMAAEDDWRQAAFVGPSFVVSLWAGVRKHYFFVLSNYLERGLQYGLLRHDRTPRPAYAALAAVGHFLAGARILGKLLAPASDGRGGTTGANSSVVAEAYVVSAKPGGGRPKDVVIVFCAPADAASATPASPLCRMPAPLLQPAVQKDTEVYDFLGRAVQQPAASAAAEGVPSSVSAACLFLVLPPGSAGALLRLQPPPEFVEKQAVDAPRTVAGSSEVAQVVLQCQWEYGAGLGFAAEAHIINGSGHAVACYAYNFGMVAVSGQVDTTIDSDSGATVTPSSWQLADIPVGGRARFVARLTPPSGRDAIDGTASGGVTLRGTFGDSPNSETAATLFFRVAPDMSTLQPAAEQPVAGATSPTAWRHNIAAGGTARVVSTARQGCVHFDLMFGASVVDAWGYPELTFNASTRPPVGTDGLRFSIIGLAAHHSGGSEQDSSTIKAVNAIFFSPNQTQYQAPTKANFSDTREQSFTLFFKDAVWVRNGPPPSRQLDANGVAQLAVGLNLNSPAAGLTGSMDVCDLRWVRF
jgi:hypothetical protein